MKRLNLAAVVMLSACTEPQEQRVSVEMESADGRTSREVALEVSPEVAAAFKAEMEKAEPEIAAPTGAYLKKAEPAR